MATTLGLCGRALDLPLTIAESGSGLVAPAVATHLMGQAGAFLILMQIFMAVTASAASEQIAISSVLSHDVYRRYVHPRATGRQVLLLARLSILLWALVSGVFSLVLNELNIGLGWIYDAMGNFVGSAVFPVAFALIWRDCSAAGAIAGAWGGAALSMLGWCLSAHRLGAINTESLGDNYSMLTGNLLALFASPLITVAVSLAAPQRFQWALLRIRTEEMLIEDDIDEKERVSHSELLHVADSLRPAVQPRPSTGRRSSSASASARRSSHHDTDEEMNRTVVFSYWAGGSLAMVLLIVWPLLACPLDTFTKPYWRFWVSIAIIWGHCAAAVTIIYPLYQA